MDKHYL